MTDGRVKIEGLLIGVARRGTDRAALYAARGVADSAYVYLDGNTQGQIAHFKIMRFKGPGKRIAIVGSGNLTRGGLFDNEEACIVLFDDGKAPDFVKGALDDIDRFLDDKLRSGYSHSINETLIARLVETGIVPVTHPRGPTGIRPHAADSGQSAVAPANIRRSYVYQRGAPPFVVPPFHGSAKPVASILPEGTPPVPARPVVRRFVKFYGDGESNRIKRLKGELPGDVGTHEFNIRPNLTESESEFWGYPALFSLNPTNLAEERSVSVRFRLGNRTQVISGGPHPPRVFLRLRQIGDDRPRVVTEARFRALSMDAMRSLYAGIDVPPNALLVVERGTDVDFEARVILPDDEEYQTLVPGNNLRQQVYTSS